MRYIIDANNLAGRLELLDEEDFDKILIEEIKKLNKKKRREYFLVFDSSDPMGDKYIDEGVVVIYTPKDSFYKNADDKIVELVKKHVNDSVLVTDDLGLIGRIEKIEVKQDVKITKIKTIDFLEEIVLKNFSSYSEKEKLSNEEINDINKEMFDLWVK